MVTGGLITARLTSLLLEAEDLLAYHGLDALDIYYRKVDLKRHLCHTGFSPVTVKVIIELYVYLLQSYQHPPDPDDLNTLLEDEMFESPEVKHLLQRDYYSAGGFIKKLEALVFRLRTTGFYSLDGLVSPCIFLRWSDDPKYNRFICVFGFQDTWWEL